MRDRLALAIQAACKELFGIDTEVELTRPDEQFGDYAANVALQLARQLGKDPRQTAQQLADNLKDRLAGDVQEISVAGLGFINLKLTDRALANLASQKSGRQMDGRNIVIEYSDPNPFKPLHAGHLYTTLVGDSIARLLENAGAQITRINYGGDVGLHTGKSMWAIIRALGGEHPEKLDDIAENEQAKWLGERYVEGASAYADNEASRAEIVETNKKVYYLHETGDRESPFARIYLVCRQWSYDYFARLYDQLQVAPFDRYIPESEVTPLGIKTVREQLESGVYELSDGAVIYDGEKAGLHKRVFISSEGLPTYETKDIGLSLTKWQDYHFDESIIITANEQAQYMQVVLASLRQFAPQPAERTKHLTHGLVKMTGGEKMSSRKGNVITALEILDAAREAGRQSGNNSSEEVVLAAVKYSFAKNRLGGDIIYDPGESIALEGNSGPYLQYAHARARSILAKAGGEYLPAEAISLEADERSLLLKITEYQEVVEKSVVELMPHYICAYLYELAQRFNRFYENNRVIDDPRQNIRLQLIKQYADVLRGGLDLLGIYAPDRM